jgi:hypothetical protein
MGFVDNEYGFWVLNWAAHLVSDNYASLFFLIASIVVGCYLYAMNRHSVNLPISVFVFFTAGFYTFLYNGARQSVACSICAIALGPLMERKFAAYLGLVLLATAFHKTAIVMLPIYFIVDSSMSGKRVIVYVLAGSVAALFLEKAVEFSATIDPRYADYAVSGEGGGFVMVSFTLSLCMFFFLYRKHVVVHRHQYFVLLNLLMFGGIISVISTVFRIAPSGILRLSLYFNVSTLFLWPIVFANVQRPIVRVVGQHLFVLGYAGFFVLSVSHFGELVPFRVNPALALDLF